MVSPTAQRLCDLEAGHCKVMVLFQTPFSSRTKRPELSASAMVLITSFAWKEEVEAFVGGGGVVGGRRGRVELATDVEGKTEWGVMVGLEEFNDDEETEPSELMCNVSKCRAVCGCENPDVVATGAGQSASVGDDEREEVRTECIVGDCCGRVTLGLSRSWIRRSTMMLALRMDTVGSIGCKWMGIETKSVGPTASVGVSMLYRIRGARSF